MVKKFFQILFLIIVTSLWTKHPKAQTDKARRAIQQAILALPQIKAAKSTTERYIKKALVLPNWALSTLSIATSGAVNGFITTNKIKGFLYKNGDFIVKPDIVFYFREGFSLAVLNLKLSF